LLASDRDLTLTTCISSNLKLKDREEVEGEKRREEGGRREAEVEGGGDGERSEMTSLV
jgi:hypothetical protein